MKWWQDATDKGMEPPLPDAVNTLSDKSGAILRELADKVEKGQASISFEIHQQTQDVMTFGSSVSQVTPGRTEMVISVEM